ncbi:MAG: alpha/beta fold hydrolase [Solirubrobacterales bacterium]
MASTQAAAAVPRPRNFYTEPEWLDVGDVRVAYRRKGTGEPTLYLHGAGFTRQWLPHLEAMSHRVDLIAPEHPGYGETAMPEWLDGFEDLVIHYDQLLDVLGLDQVHLVGYSLGGWLAAEFASFYPKRLKSLTLMVPAGLRILGKPIPNPVAMMPDAFFELIFNDKANMHQVLPDFEDFDEIVHAYGEGATLARLAWSTQYNLKLERRLERVTCPALVMRAEHDRLICDEMAERYAELLPNSRVEAIPGTGHALAVEQPQRVASAIADFIQEAAR